jgi:protein KRI1
MPTRFKYTTVPPDHFSLTPAEVLMATDRELNEYVSIKRMAPYKNKAAWDKERVAKLKALKETINGRTWGGVPVEELSRNESGANGQDGKPAKKRKGKKERLKAKKLAEPQEGRKDGRHSMRVTKDIEDEEAARPRKKRRKDKDRAE